MKRMFLIFTIFVKVFSFNDVRIVQFFDINDSALQRAKNSNYNYIVVPFEFRASDTIIGNGDVYENLKIDMLNATKKLYKYNLKIIPMISMSSKWALHWQVLKKFENSNIGMNTIYTDDNIPNPLNFYGIYHSLNMLRGGGEHYDKGSICDMKNVESVANMGSNSWSYEKNGVDNSIFKVFQAIKDGFDISNVNYNLEYLHIGHDEPQFLNWNLMGGVAYPCGNAYPYRGNFARGEVSNSDIKYIDSLKNMGISASKAYQTLLANEIYRRIIQAKSIFKNIKIMFFAESFDDQSWGGVKWFAKYGEKAAKIYMSNVISLPGLSSEEKKMVKDNIILILWNYDSKVVYEGNILNYLVSHKYNTDYAFKRLSDNGFKFLYIGALEHGNNSKEQIKSFSIYNEKYRKNCLGYYSVAWDVGYPNDKWNIIEYMPSTQIKEFYSFPNIQKVSFNNECISFYLFQDNYVKIEIFNMQGRSVKKICNSVMKEGHHAFKFKKSSSMYIMKIIDGNSKSAKSILLRK